MSNKAEFFEQQIKNNKPQVGGNTVGSTNRPTGWAKEESGWPKGL